MTNAYVRWSVPLALVLMLTAMAARPVVANTATISWWVVNHNAATRTAIAETIIPAFEEASPGTKVDVSYLSWGTVFTDKVTVAFASGTAPDILQRGCNEIYDIVWNRQAIALDRYLEEWRDREDFIPETWHGVVVHEGSVYGLPSLTSPRLLYYRRDVFGQLGFDPDSAPRTWDELIRIAKLATVTHPDGGYTRIGFRVNASNQQWTDFVRQNGGDIYDVEKKRYVFDSQEGIEALDFYVELYKATRVPGVAWSMHGKSSVGLMVSDDIAMEIAARSAALNVERQAPEELENVGVGYPPGPVRSAATTYTDYWTITTQSKHPDQAWRFLQFLMKPDILVAYNETMGFLPPRKSMLRHPYVARNRFNRVFMTSLLDGVSLPLPVTPLGRQAEFLLNDALATAVKQTTPPAGILQDAGRRANAFLRELWERLGERVE